MSTLETESEVVEKCEPKIETAAAKESPHQAYYLLPKNGVVYTRVHCIVLSISLVEVMHALFGANA